MKKQKWKMFWGLFSLLAATGLILYACSEENWNPDWSEDATMSASQEFTVDAAKEWFDANSTPVIGLRRAKGGKTSALVKPN